MRLLAGTFLVVAVLAAVPRLKAQTYTYPQLVERMTDMEQLARLPSPGEKTSLASSYDRASKYDAAADKYINWGANGDGKGIISKEGESSILANIKGPGVITRIWSATPGAGHVKIFLDGSDSPTVDLAFADYFNRTKDPFNRKNLVYGLQPQAPGFDNYTPISFKQSCRIVADDNWGDYYQFTYTQFPAGTVLPTFSMKLSSGDEAALDKANVTLGFAGQKPGDGRGTTKTITVEAAPGNDTTVADFAGAGAISALTVKVSLPVDAEAARVLLSQLTLSVTWDGDTDPAVWSPLGDFFGYVGGAMPYQSLPLGLSEHGTFYSFWYMPFARKAHISVGNDGRGPIAMTWSITREPLKEPVARLGRFHAKWHRDAFLPDRLDRTPDWTLVTTQGRGRYVGTHLHGWNPIGGWWGEGDDKFYVDGEKFPSSFGTGSEDYFGYAWSSDRTFSRPYHGQILNEGNRGHFDDNRWHIADSEPFQTSFEADIEKYFPNKWETYYAAEAYWYLDAKGTDPYTAVPAAERVGYWQKTAIRREADAIEGESLRVMNKPAVRPANQIMVDFGSDWSGGRQMLWKGSLGDTLELALPVARTGKYQLMLRCTKAPANGMVKVSVDDRVVTDSIDLFATQLRAAVPAEASAVPLALSAGEHKLTIEIVGKNVASTGTAFALDYLKLVPVD